MSNKYQIKDIEIFRFDDGTESADVRVQFGDAELSIQLGTNDKWSFAPEADVAHGDIGRFVSEYPNIDAAAAGMAALVDARRAIESANTDHLETRGRK